MTQDALDNIGKEFIKRSETIAVAESVTSGLIQSSFGSMENAQQFFQGGITTYNTGQKTRILSVEPIHALAVNAVSQHVADQLALHVCNFFLSDWGIGITGYASPVPESKNEIFAYYAIAYKGRLISSGKVEPTEKDPGKVKEFYVEVILNEISKAFSQKNTSDISLDITV